MSWDEIHTRVAQEAGKRFDLALYRSGFAFGKNGSGHAAKAGRFFFSDAEAPGRVEVLRKYLPSAVEDTLREAGEICHHRFRLLGYDPLCFGPAIDWHCDAVHGKRAPLKPWFKIRYLDFDEVGDHKIIWELNRHQHLVTLAKAWRLTGDDRYAKELVAQWYSWREASPYPLGINWASSLEVAFRSLSWLWLRRLLAGSSAVPRAFDGDLLAALALSGRHIERFLSTYFSPNTHLLGEATALFFIGTLCPQIHSAARWQRKGWSILLEEAHRQVRPDGTYFEQALYYHVYALDMFLHARQLAVCNEISISADFDAQLNRMLEFLQVVSQAGAPHSFGDDDGGRLFNPRRNRAEHLTDPLVLGASTFGRDDLTGAAVTEEAIWLFGEQAARWPRQAGAETLRAKTFPAGGIYVMAGGKGRRQQLVIDAGPQGVGHCGHGHADALSLSVSFGGRAWLVDPGTGSYVSGGDGRDLFRGTSAHNTLRVDGVDQAVPTGPFSWDALPDVCVERWIEGNTFSCFAGSHTGYGRLPDPVLHRREVFHLPGGFWVVRDVAEGKREHLLELFWHFTPDLKVTNKDGNFIARPAVADASFALIPLKQSDWTGELETGYVSPAYGLREPAPVLRLRARASLPAEFVTVLQPVSAPGELRALSHAASQDGLQVYEYGNAGRTHFFIFCDRPHRAWNWGSWTSDAEFVYVCLSGGRLVHFALCTGSFAIFDGKPLLTHPTTLERFEWQEEAGEGRVFSSEPGVTESSASASRAMFVELASK